MSTGEPADVLVRRAFAIVETGLAPNLSALRRSAVMVELSQRQTPTSRRSAMWPVCSAE
jgi:hypothetical protein